MTDNFTPPGEGWVEDNTPWEHAPQDNEVVVYTGPNGVRRWHRRIEPPLPTEPGWYLSRSGRPWQLTSKGGWLDPFGTLHTNLSYVHAYGPFTRLVPEDEVQEQVYQAFEDFAQQVKSRSGRLGALHEEIMRYFQGDR